MLQQSPTFSNPLIEQILETFSVYMENLLSIHHFKHILNRYEELSINTLLLLRAKFAQCHDIFHKN